MEMLSLIHGDRVRAGIFADVVAERGHTLEEWSSAWEEPLPRPLDDYGAVLVFGGAMHADQVDHHPWLREENLILQRLLHLGTPVLGVCLGSQLLARAAHADVYPAREPEVGWLPVEVTDDGAQDPVLAGLPRRFDAFQWHYHAHNIPAGGTELARSDICTQAFRLGENVWGVQFHPEVTLAQVEGWVAEEPEAPIDGDALLAQTRERMDEWNAIGRKLCGAFVEVAERAAAPVG